MVIQKFLIFLFIILPEFAAAKALSRQDDSLFIHNKFCGIGWGARRLPLASLTAFLSHNYGVAPLTSLATSVGIELGISDVILVSNLNRTQNRLSAHIYLPQTTSSSLASFKMSGYEVYFDAYSPNFIRRKNMGFSVGLAWCFGRIKITQTDISGISAFSNPYFTPVLQTEGHILLFNRLHTGIRYMYRVDASKTGWKRKSGNAPDLPGTRLSGGSGSMFLAWAF